MSITKWLEARAQLAELIETMEEEALASPDAEEEEEAAPEAAEPIPDLDAPLPIRGPRRRTPVVPL